MEKKRRINDLPAIKAPVKIHNTHSLISCYTLQSALDRCIYARNTTREVSFPLVLFLNIFISCISVLIVTFLIAVCLVTRDDMMLTMTTMMTKYSRHNQDIDIFSTCKHIIHKQPKIEEEQKMPYGEH